MRRPDTSTNICLCVLTHSRAHGLQRAISSLTQQSAPSGCAVTVLVVDNSTHGYARDIVAAAIRDSPVPIAYAHQPAAGIAAARNAALDFARRFDFLGFVDDDEVVVNDWLEHHFASLQKRGAAVSAGPVARVYEPDAPPHLIDAAPYNRSSPLRDGSLVEDVGSGNVLLDMSVLRESEDLRFDDSLGTSGGEDTDLFRRIASNYGGHAVWTADALAFEFIPNSRLEIPFLLRRSLRAGNVSLLLEVRSAKSQLLVRTRGILRAAVLLLAGSLRTATAPLAGSSRTRATKAVEGMMLLARSVGAGLALVGLQYNEYAASRRIRRHRPSGPPLR
jgi:glycosyltransferase involved in cell wall biosynthesis